MLLPACVEAIWIPDIHTSVCNPGPDLATETLLHFCLSLFLFRLNELGSVTRLLEPIEHTKYITSTKEEGSYPSG